MPHDSRLERVPRGHYFFRQPAAGALFRSRALSSSPPLSRGTKDPAILKTQLIGDPATIGQLTAFFAATGIRTVVEDSRQADELILCEGAQFSFKDCIRSLEAAAPYRTGLRVKFYAEGSGSVVGSAYRDGRGETIEAVPHR